MTTGSLKWLDYFTENVSDIAISVDKKPMVRVADPEVKDFTPIELGVNCHYEDADDAVVSQAEFFYEISKVLHTQDHWEKLFSRDGVNIAASSESSRFRLNAYVSNHGPVANIRRIPTELSPL